MSTTKLKNFFVKFSASAVLLFLYVPLFVIILYSFNAETVNSFPIQKFSTRWYSEMAADKELLQSVYSSIYIALISTLVALIIGIPAAYTMHKHDFPGKKIIDKIVLMPITLPGIVTGVSMLSFFPFVGVKISLQAVMIGHITFLCAIVVTQMMARFKRLDPFLEQRHFVGTQQTTRGVGQKAGQAIGQEHHRQRSRDRREARADFT